MENKFKKSFLTCAVFLLLISAGLQAVIGFYVNNGRLLDVNGNEFVIRGVSHAHAWYTDRTSSFADIKSVDANTVRVVLK